MQSNRDLHSIGSYSCSIGSYLSSIRSYFHFTGSYLSSIRLYFHSIGSYLSSIASYFHSIGSYLSFFRSYFNYFVASYMTLVYSSVIFHIYPYLRGNSIPSDRNYRSAVVTIWLNLDLVLVWRHTTYDYTTYNWKSSRTCGKMAQEGQHQCPLELITQNVRSILADVLNKLECGDVDHSIEGNSKGWQATQSPPVWNIWEPLYLCSNECIF